MRRTGQAPSPSRRLTVLVGVLAVSVVGTAAVAGCAHATTGAKRSGPKPTAHPATAHPATALCGVADPRGSGPGAYETPATYTSAPAQVAPHVVYASSQVVGFYFDRADQDIYVKTPASVVVANASSRVLHVFALPTETVRGLALQPGNANGSLVVGPRGDIYFFMMQGYGYVLVKLSPSGRQRWDLGVPGVPNGLFAWHDAAGAWAAAVIARLPASSELVSASGRVAPGKEPVPGTNNADAVGPAPGGGLIYNDGDYVGVLSASGSPVAASAGVVPEFGNATAPTSPGTPGAPLALGSGGAAKVGSAVYVAGQPGGIGVFTSTGVYEGDASGALGVVPGSNLYYDRQRRALIYSGHAGVESVSLAHVQALLRSPSAPTEAGFGDALGVGAGLSTPVTAGYFPPGTRPSITATFDTWWRSYPHALALEYWVADGHQVTAGALPATAVLRLSWSGVARGAPLRARLAAPGAPGVYLVNADLVDRATGKTIGSTCLTYSVGAQGDKLDFAHLAGAPGYGGPSPERGVELASELGTGAMREQLSLPALLPRCDGSAPTRSTCGPAALTNWSYYDPVTEQAAKKAKALHVDFEVQFGQDESLDEALVSSGYWEADVKAIVAHFARTAPDLRYVEAWNEPNTGPYDPSSYVHSILGPFYKAVKGAAAGDGKHLEVIGGTVNEMDVAGWWTGIARSGGFSYMDVVGIHPYPGYDRSFEEEGTPAAIDALKALMARYGAASMPIWDTEQGWWSDGEQAFYDVGNWAPREWMWLRALGVATWDYFITEGQYSGVGTDFSLIDAANGDYYVKPGAIGLMTVSHLLADRPFLRQVDIGIPHAYGMLFGPPSRGKATGDILALWTDDLDVPAEVSLLSGPGSVTVPTTGSLGEPGSLSLSKTAPTRVELSGAPLYLSLPAGVSVSVGAPESYGPNLALASEGARAVASSSQGGDNSPSAVIQGNSGADNGGSIGSTPAWASEQGKHYPWVQVNFSRPVTVDRVIVSTSSVGSVLPGLRDYAVRVDAGGKWATVGKVENEYFNRMEEVSFAPRRQVTAIRVVTKALTFNSAVGGLAPYFWSSRFPDYAVVYSVEAYAPGSRAPAARRR
ncbi:MAG: discoidin domain-containing protein [Acidimicrobiales bacterium]